MALFDPQQFLSFASDMVRDRPHTEAALRSAISRAYYSVLLTARDQLFGVDEIGLTERIRKEIRKKYKIRRDRSKGLGSHELIIFAATEKRIVVGQQLEQLKEARVYADYKRNSTQVLADVKKPSWSDYAKETLELAALALPSARKLPSYSP